MEKTKNKFRMSREARKLEPLKIEDSSFNEKFDHNLEDVVVDFSDDKKTEEYKYPPVYAAQTSPSRSITSPPPPPRRTTSLAPRWPLWQRGRTPP